MTKSNLIWSDDDTDWQWKHYRLPVPRRAAPRGYRSHMMAALIEQEQQRQQHEAAIVFGLHEQVKMLAESARRERLQAAVRKHGAAVVEGVLHIELPAELKEQG
jgi:hypothetical protein